MAKVKNKYGNQINEFDGHIFDSIKERQRYCELKLLERAGEIKDLKVHPVYYLQGPFRYQGKTERAISYIADFQYTTTSNNQVIIEDVKGMKTQAYQIKRKLLLYKCKEGIYIQADGQDVKCNPEFYEV